MTTPTDTRKRKPALPKIRKDIPAPSSPEGELFHYTPDEAAQYLPFSARTLREMAYLREIPHSSNGNRVSFAGIHIRAITEQFTVEVLSASKRAATAA